MKSIWLFLFLFIPLFAFSQKLPDLKMDIFPKVFEEYKPIKTEGNEVGIIINMQAFNPASTTYYCTLKEDEPVSCKTVFRENPWDYDNEVVKEFQLDKEKSAMLFSQLFDTGKLDELLKFNNSDFNVSNESECFILDGMGVNFTVVQYDKVAHLYCYEPYFRLNGCPDDKTINRDAMKAFTGVMDVILQVFKIELQ